MQPSARLAASSFVAVSTNLTRKGGITQQQLKTAVNPKGWKPRAKQNKATKHVMKSKVGRITQNQRGNVVIRGAANKTSEAATEEVEEEKKKKNNKPSPDTHPSVRKRWNKLKSSLHPTQTALGWDWVLFKMKNLSCEEEAQKYLDRKPVPAVKRGDTYYIVDHHHTLCALEASGWNVKVTIVVIMEVPEDLATIEQFWDFMKNRGWSFVRNGDYTHATYEKIPSGFGIEEFHNDIYRSMGGFARLYKVLKRPKNLEARLFFEFKWGYFFYTHKDDQFDLWHDKRLFRSWNRVLNLLQETDMQEYVSDNMKNLSVAECTYLSENVIEPAYRLTMFYLRALCLQYDSLSDEDKQQAVPELPLMFGENNTVLPKNCILESEDYSYGTSLDDGDSLSTFDEGFDEYGDEGNFTSWQLEPWLFGSLNSTSPSPENNEETVTPKVSTSEEEDAIVI